jgi:hypothetical protein
MQGLMHPLLLKKGFRMMFFLVPFADWHQAGCKLMPIDASVWAAGWLLNGVILHSNIAPVVDWSCRVTPPG